MINWLKKNYLIAVLFLITVFILVIKINTRIKDNQINNLPTILDNKDKAENKKEILISPTPTIINKTTFRNKTRNEILEMKPEDRYEFITSLNREEVEQLDMMPNYDFSDFLPFTSENFIVEKFDYQNKKLTVKPLIEDKIKIKKEVDNWLFYSNGNNPKKIEIIWNE